MNRRILLLTAAVLMLGGCDGGTGLDDQISGRYELRAVNFVTVPYFTDVGGTRIEVTGGYLQFDQDATYSMASMSRTVVGAPRSDTVRTGGTWMQDRDQLRLETASGLSVEGFGDAELVVLMVNGHAYEYRK